MYKLFSDHISNSGHFRNTCIRKLIVSDWKALQTQELLSSEVCTLASRGQEGSFGLRMTSCSKSGLLLANLATRWGIELSDVEGLLQILCGPAQARVCSPRAFRLLFLGRCPLPPNSVELMETRLGCF